MKKSRLSLYPFGLILIIYAGLSFHQVNLPGLHYDEAFEAVPALQMLRGQPVAATEPSSAGLTEC